MYNILRILIGVPDYSSSSLFLNEEEAIPPPPRQTKYSGYTIYPPPPDKQNTPGIYIGIPSTCTEDVQYI